MYMNVITCTSTFALNFDTCSWSGCGDGGGGGGGGGGRQVGPQIINAQTATALPVPALPPGEVDQEQMVPMDAMEPPPPAPVLRRSTRHHRPPDRFLKGEKCSIVIYCVIVIA